MGVSDALAGKTVRCPKCGDAIFVAAAPQAGKAAGKPQKTTPGFYMSSGQIILLCVIAGLVIVGILVYVGPVRVSHQWDDMEPNARGTVMNLVTYSLKAYLSRTGDWDPSVPHNIPAIERSGVGFNRPLLRLTLPEKVGFAGSSNQGAFEGLYDTRTGAIEANVYYGGYTVAGLVNLKKPTGHFHLVGHEENGKPIVEVDGKQIDIIYSK
jgi:hypothetical protein